MVHGPKTHIDIAWHPAARCPLPEAALAPLQQHPAYAAALGANGAGAAHDIRAAELKYQGRVIGRAQVMLRRLPLIGTVAYLPRGPVWIDDLAPPPLPKAPAPQGPQGPEGSEGTARPAPEGQSGLPQAVMQSALKALRRSLGQSATAPRLWIGNADTARAAQAMARIGDLPMITPQYVAELDLRPDHDSRLARQHGKWRNRLRHAQAQDLHISHRPLKPARDGWLLAAEAHQQTTNGYRALPVSFAAGYPADLTRLFLAERKGEVIAAMLILRHGAVASYHIGWSSSAGKAASAHNLLLWQAGNWLARKGVQRLDLGTLDTQAAAGLARFKLGAGADLRALGPTMLYCRASAPMGLIRARLKHAA